MRAGVKAVESLARTGQIQIVLRKQLTRGSDQLDVMECGQLLYLCSERCFRSTAVEAVLVADVDSGQLLCVMLAISGF